MENFIFENFKIEISLIKENSLFLDGIYSVTNIGVYTYVLGKNDLNLQIHN